MSSVCNTLKRFGVAWLLACLVITGDDSWFSMQRLRFGSVKPVAPSMAVGRSLVMLVVGKGGYSSHDGFAPVRCCVCCHCLPGMGMSNRAV